MDFRGMTNKEILVHLATQQEERESVRKEQNKLNSEKFVKLESEDGKLHHRVNEVHERVNTIKFWSVGSAGLGSLVGSFVGWWSNVWKT